MFRLLSSCALALALASCGTQVMHYAGENPDLPFSNAVRAGNTLYVAGHLGLDPVTGHAPADPAAEAGLALDAVGRTLERAGLTMNDLVSVQVYCSDVALYDTFNTVYRERFSGAFPARAFIGSGALLRGAHFEVLGVAVYR